ncbi:hypothetical protein [Parasphingorhabdus sp.]|uniref:hypothetical protein n=1 Tax=Parasphingorhabdus sp. TaxID=2709688 RepID=UPI003A92EDE4
MNRWPQNFFIIIAIGLAACSAPDNSAKNDTAEVSDQASSAAMPRLEDQTALLEKFRNEGQDRCRFFKETQGTSGDFEGADLLLCSGRTASDENYAIALFTSDGAQFPKGTVYSDFGIHPHPAGYRRLYDLLSRMTGISGANEKQEFLAALTRYKIAAPHMPGTDYRPLFKTKSGMNIEMAYNRSQPGLMTFKATPLR